RRRGRRLADLLPPRVRRRVADPPGPRRDGRQLRAQGRMGSRNDALHLPDREPAEARRARGLLRQGHGLHAVLDRDMMVESFARVRRRLARPLPLLRYLVLTTETHAFCGALAFFALLGFYPGSSLLLSLSRNPLGWDKAHDVLLQALREYYPEGQGFLLRNLEATVARHGRELLDSILWILLGAAGVFIPLEAAFNRVWGFREHRPYWRNQLAGLLLTAACCG